MRFSQRNIERTRGLFSSGTIWRAGGAPMGQEDIFFWTPESRLPFLPTENYHVALVCMSRITHEYQSDSSSKNPIEADLKPFLYLLWDKFG